jgi:hypothetical protein
VVGPAGKGVVRIGRWGIYVLAVYEYGRRAYEAQLLSLLFALDFDDLDIDADPLLGQHPAQSFECQLVRRAVFVKQETYVHQNPFKFTYY